MIPTHMIKTFQSVGAILTSRHAQTKTVCLRSSVREYWYCPTVPILFLAPLAAASAPLVPRLIVV
jgi:hypothetical protein